MGVRRDLAGRADENRPAVPREVLSDAHRLGQFAASAFKRTFVDLATLSSARNYGATMEYAIGIVLALIVSCFARVTGLDRDRAFYSTLAIVVASYYVLFAAMGG